MNASYSVPPTRLVRSLLVPPPSDALNCHEFGKTSSPAILTHPRSAHGEDDFHFLPAIAAVSSLDLQSTAAMSHWTKAKT